MFGRTILIALCATVGLAIVSPRPASAQTSSSADMAYCAKLIDLYSRYLTGDEFGDRRTSLGGASLDGRVAVAKCREGDTASGIPVLERKLLANGFTLPRR